ncbi:MAG: hypothetical protein AUH85_01725 [Chloroflexi bacterium 13_1_40CM_4_68_4]|nr:MAG: hypothetical protein AUH85_01725 [Chloroflexi bacterium 13_1_40CM_4_68_4]
MNRLLLLSEPADEADGRVFIARLSAVMPGTTLDHFSPAFSFGSVPSWLVQESRSRIASADGIVCLLGTTSIASAWATWAITAGLDVEKRVACVRLHSNPARDVPPPIANTRHVAVMDADTSLLAAYLLEGKLPPERQRKTEPPVEAPLMTRFGKSA